VHADLWPHRTLLLDLPVAEGLARARQRGAVADRFEAQQQDFFQRVRSAYLARAAADPARIRIIDARASESQVAAAALSAIEDLLRP
jgi:dTMP kinase